MHKIAVIVAMLSLPMLSFQNRYVSNNPSLIDNGIDPNAGNMHAYNILVNPDWVCTAVNTSTVTYTVTCNTGAQ